MHNRPSVVSDEMKDSIVKIIIDVVQQLDLPRDLHVPQIVSEETLLYGKGGILDSMALVSVVVAVEQAIEDEIGVNISLADARAMSQKHSPYLTVGSLADYARVLVCKI
jgi:acyl carrier protein